jgi:hypothetical protein
VSIWPSTRGDASAWNLDGPSTAEREPSAPNDTQETGDAQLGVTNSHADAYTLADPSWTPPGEPYDRTNAEHERVRKPPGKPYPPDLFWYDMKGGEMDEVGPVYSYVGWYLVPGQPSHGASYYGGRGVWRTLTPVITPMFGPDRGRVKGTPRWLTEWWWGLITSDGKVYPPGSPDPPGVVPPAEPDTGATLGEMAVRRGNMTVSLDRKRRIIRIFGRQEFRGDGATDDYIARATNCINETWSGPTTFEGMKYHVICNVTAQSGGASPDLGANQVEVKQTGDTFSVMSNRDPSHVFGTTVYLRSNDMDGGQLTPAHEFGHSMGLPDEYEESFVSWLGGFSGLWDRECRLTGPVGGLMGRSGPGSRPTPGNIHDLIYGRP